MKPLLVLLNVLLLGIFVCSQSGNRPYKDVGKSDDYLYEDLAKSGYKHTHTHI